MRRSLLPSRSALHPWFLLGEGLLWLAAMVGLFMGLQAVIEAALPPSDWRAHEDTYCFRASSDSYGALFDWLDAQPETENVDIAWNKPCITVTYTRPEAKPALSPPWKTLGFEPPLTARHESKPEPRVTTLAGKWARVLSTTITTLLVALIGLWTARRRGVALLPLFRGSAARAVAVGLMAGCALLVLNFLAVGPLNDLARRLLPGLKPWARPEVFHTGITASVLTLGVFVPVSEELFFRALFFGRIAAAGHQVFGALASAAVFAAVHGDPWNFMFLFVAGIILAETYRRTGSLIAPIVAHGINNVLPLFLFLRG